MFTSIKSVVKTALSALFGTSKPTDTTLPDGHTVTRETFEDGTWGATTHDTMGCVTRIDDYDGHWSTYQYDDQGRVTRYENSRGHVETHTYDTAGARTTTVVVAYPPPATALSPWLHLTTR